MSHVELNNVGEWGNWYRAARTVLMRRPTDGCGISDPSEEMVEKKAMELEQANRQHLSDDHWVADDSASTPVDSDARWFADLYDDVEIYVPDDFCPVEEPAPEPVEVQPEPTPVLPPPPPADAGAGDQDAGATPPPDAATTPPADAGAAPTQTGDAGTGDADQVDADGDTVVDADQAETEDAARRRDAQRRENGTQSSDSGNTPPRDAGRREVFVP